MRGLKNLLIIIIAINISPKFYAQNLEQTLIFADSMFSENKIDLALKEYLRIYFLDKENKYASVSDKISTCFFKKEDINNAIRYQDIYYFKLKSGDALRNEVRYKKQMMYLISEQYNKALIEILQINKKNHFDADRHQFLLSLNYLLSNDLIKAKNELYKLSYYSRLDTTAINLAFIKLMKNKDKNPKNARWLSTIVPGLGQIVNGEFKDGINSLGLFIGFLAVWTELSKSIGIGDASLSVAPWILRYYIGGLTNAVEAAKKKKHNVKQQQIDSLISIIEKGKIN